MKLWPFQQQPIQVNAQWVTTANSYLTNGTGVATTPITLNGVASPAPPPDPMAAVSGPARPSKVESILAKLRGEDPELADKIAAMPLIAGAAREAETERTDELVHRKKITLRRNVGASHKDVKGGTPTHQGTVELVRTLSGNKNEIGTIGVKSTGDNSGFVEIPIDDLVAAIADLQAGK